MTGTRKTDTLTYPCQETSKINSKNVKTIEKDHLKIVHTQLIPRSCPRSLPRRPYQGFIKRLEKRVQKVVGSILYYTWAVNITLLMAQSTVAAKQFKDTEFSADTIEQPLNYCAIHPNKKSGTKKLI